MDNFINLSNVFEFFKIFIKKKIFKTLSYVYV